MKKLLIFALVGLLFSTATAFASSNDNENQAGVGAELTVFELPQHKLQPAVVLDYEKDIKNNSFNFMAKVKLNVFNWLQNESD